MLVANKDAANSARERIMVVESNTDLAVLISMYLRSEGAQVIMVESSEDVIECSQNFNPDVIVMSTNLCNISVKDMFNTLRSSGNMKPILFMSEGDDIDKGLTVGGDNYITKPFSMEELSAGIRSLIRTAEYLETGEEVCPIISLDGLHLNEDTYEVTFGQHSIELTSTEFDLLRYMLRNVNKVLSRPQILDRVWHYSFEGRHTVVELYISYLRKKLELVGAPLIHTVRGNGYILKPMR